MPTVNVKTRLGARVLAATLRQQVFSERERKRLARKVAKLLPKEQRRYFGTKLKDHAPRTEADRDAARGYYGEQQPNDRARRDWPYMEWTGAMREATAKVTRERGSGVVVDPDKNYRGPIPQRWSTVWDRHLKTVSPWDLERIRQLAERRTIPDWLNDQVRRVRRAFGV